MLFAFAHFPQTTIPAFAEVTADSFDLEFGV